MSPEWYEMHLVIGLCEDTRLVLRPNPDFGPDAPILVEEVWYADSDSRSWKETHTTYLMTVETLRLLVDAANRFATFAADRAKPKQED